VPAGSPVPVEDLRWALSGLCFEAGPGRSARLVPADEADGDGFLQHYGADAPGLVWQTVTPVALGGDGAELAGRVAAALRHAGLPAGLRGLRAQREPFHAKGRPAGDFAEGTRFPAAALWHLELELSRPVRGPLRLGDGRHLGLGLLRPAPAEGGLYALEVVGGLAAGADPTGLARALRAAVMARAQAVLGPRAALPAYLHGHEPEAGPRRGHLHFVWDPPRHRLLLVAPHRAERRGAGAAERAHLHTLERALEGFTELRAGGAGLLQLRPAAVDGGADPLLGRSPMWASVTPYRVDRHRPAGSAADALVADVQASLAAAGLPRAEVEVRQVRARPGVGLEGELSLIFAAAVEGPLLLGRSRHLGGGLFERQG
jgi:CRISPR-associated protein Csb2